MKTIEITPLEYKETVKPLLIKEGINFDILKIKNGILIILVPISFIIKYGF